MNGFEHTLIADWRSIGFVALKTAALFLTAAVAFRFVQRRTLSELSPIDWVAAVAVGAVIGRTATAAGTSWLIGATALLTLIALHAALNRLRFLPGARRYIDPPTRELVRNGKVSRRNLRRCGFTPSDLEAILRQHGHLDASSVRLALFEEKGSVSVIAEPTPGTSHASDAPRR
jgi:uncharacterized membrane protein YcaP (DUF421 family)